MPYIHYPITFLWPMPMPAKSMITVNVSTGLPSLAAWQHGNSTHDNLAGQGLHLLGAVASNHLHAVNVRLLNQRKNQKMTQILLIAYELEHKDDEHILNRETRSNSSSVTLSSKGCAASMPIFSI